MSQTLYWWTSRCPEQGEWRTAPTSRELEVLELVAKGLGNRAIANQLNVSEATVKTHLVHLFSKLDVDSRTAAVSVAVDQGLIRLN